VPDSDTKADCYSAGERKWMELGQRLRAAWLTQLLKRLDQAKISPDHVTLASLVCGVLFVPLWLSGLFWVAVISLVLHVLLDGIDGPLARFQGVDSQRGSFTDSFCDQIIVSIVTIALMSGTQPQVGVWGGSLFVLLYVGVLAMSMVRNALQSPYSWLVRPRFFVYAAIAAELIGVTNAVAWTIWISNALLAIKATSGFFKLRQRLPG
jgi:phosphatidylglycerophosphate synthase